jgi:hypothetical protein
MIRQCLGLGLRLGKQALMRRPCFFKSEDNNYGIKFDEQEIKRKMI